MYPFISFLVLTFIPLTCLPTVVSEIKIGAFNVRIFGRSKMSKPHVVDTLVRILSRYDVVLVQEIRDSEGTAIEALLAALNDFSATRYTYVISERLGRTNSKEQYAFFYKDNGSIEVTETYTYNDTKSATVHDTFEREPFIVKFLFRNTDIGTVVLGGVHLKPSDVLQELNSLPDVFADITSRWGTDDIMIMGDMNADCSYLRVKDRPEVELMNDTNYYWPIGDDVDTTVGGTNCAYDRFIITGSGLRKMIVNDSSTVFDFEHAYNLNRSSALEVSDHYPIEISITKSQPRADFKIAAFNIRHFGQTKAGKPGVMMALAKIIRRYDIVFIQGIEDGSSPTSFFNLVDIINKIGTPRYLSQVDTMGGNTSFRETYAYLYKSDESLELLSHYVYNDQSRQLFKREPFIAKFRSTKTYIQTFALIGIRVDTSNAEAELNGLSKVVQDVQQSCLTSDIIILGDLAADCSYLSQRKWNELDLVTDTNYFWPIDESVDTTVSSSDCATDRFIIHGQNSMDGIVNRSASVFNFQTFYNYNHTFAREISNHFPIELTLKWQDSMTTQSIITTLHATMDTISERPDPSINPTETSQGNVSPDSTSPPINTASQADVPTDSRSPPINPTSQPHMSTDSRRSPPINTTSQADVPTDSRSPPINPTSQPYVSTDSRSSRADTVHKNYFIVSIVMTLAILSFR